MDDLLNVLDHLPTILTWNLTPHLLSPFMICKGIFLLVNFVFRTNSALIRYSYSLIPILHIIVYNLVLLNMQKLRIESTQSMSVTMGNGELLCREGIC